MVTTNNLFWEDRPWGRYKVVYSDPETTVKLLEVFHGEALSLQYHAHRDEHWTLLDPFPGGGVTFTINGEFLTPVPGVRYDVPRSVVHRISNFSGYPITVLEVAKGLFDELDIVRVHDKYGRK